VSAVYLIKRGPREPHHRAPFHPVIICAKRGVAKWEAGWTGAAAWVWSHERGLRVGGWLLERWNGFDVDYGHVVRGVTMPDGTDAAFVHEHTGREPWPLLAGAVWWDDKSMPRWIADAGVVYAPDAFSQEAILRDISNDRQDRNASTMGVERPAFWPAPAPKQTWEVTGEARIPNGARVRFTEGIGCYSRPDTGEVIGLTATLELPNGRYDDLYRIRADDGREVQRSRGLVEQDNPSEVAHA
jgi:hypothetical protein